MIWAPNFPCRVALILIFCLLAANAHARKCRVRNQPMEDSCTVSAKQDALSQSIGEFKSILRAWSASTAKKYASSKSDQASEEDILKAYEFERSLEETDIPFCDETLAENVLKPDLAKSDYKLYLGGSNDGKKCGYLEVISESALDENGDIRKSVKEMNLDPCCVPAEVKAMLSDASGHVAGFMVGVEAGASIPGLGMVGAGANANIGREVVFLRTGVDTMQIAVVRYNALATAVGLPVGASITGGMLYGNCLKITDYLGFFKTYALAGIHLENVGMSSHPYDLGATRTNCNSKSFTTGATASLVGIEGSYYQLASKSIEVKGPRVKALIEMIDRADRDALNRERTAPDQPKSYTQERFKKAECSDNLLIQAGDQGIAGVAELIKKNAQTQPKDM